MVTLTAFTIVFELLPPIIVSLLYLIFFRKRNRFIEAFIILLYIKSVTYFLYYEMVQSELVPLYFDPFVPDHVFLQIFGLEFVFQFAYALQELLTWIMVSFFAVLFGMVVLAVKMALQDPLKMKFSNVIKKLSGSEPVSDGYSGFRDRLHNLRFEGVPENPLDPAVQSRAWSSAWRDYLIIGLATLLPTVPVYIGTFSDYVLMVTGSPDYTPPNGYVFGVMIFLTWIYRFGYPASNRIAKGAGLKLGDRDVGGEMMRGVLGWFFRLNLLLTLILLANDILNAYYNGLLGYLGMYYVAGLIQAFPPILFAIVVLPLVERFSVILYKRIFDSLLHAGSKIRGFSLRGVITTLVSSVSTGVFTAGVFVAAIMGVTLYTAVHLLGVFTVHPKAIDFTTDPSDYDVFTALSAPPNNLMTILPSLWVVLILLIPMVTMILTGVISHYVQDRLSVGMESFAFFAGFVASTLSYFILPGLDYLIQLATTPVQSETFGTFYHLRPLILIPGAEEWLYRLAAQFVVNMPIFISATLFLMYYFEYRERWREESGESSGPLLNVHARDIYDAVGMFFGGIVLTVIGVAALSFVADPYFVGPWFDALIAEIGLPDGLELVLASTSLRFTIVLEHNIIRTFLMLVAGPVFWSIILWLVAAQKRGGDIRVGVLGIVLAAIGAAVAYIWTILDIERGVLRPSQAEGDAFWPWTFSAALGYRAAVILVPLFVVMLVAAFASKATEGRANPWWFPPLILAFTIEYFVYDDQFTLIALVVLPMIIAGPYKLVYSGRPEVRAEDPLITYIRFSLMSVGIAEVLSTALWLAGLATLHAFIGDLTLFLAYVLPHGVVEIPAFLFAAAASFRIAREIAPVVVEERWDDVPEHTKKVLTDGRLWRTYGLVLFFLVIAALVEAYITELVVQMVASGLPIW